MGSIWKENQKRACRKDSVAASDDHDLVRVEDLPNLASLAPSGDLTNITSITGVDGGVGENGEDLDLRAGNGDNSGAQRDGGDFTAFAGSAAGVPLGTGGDYLVGAGGGNIAGTARMTGGAGGGVSEIVGGGNAISTAGPARVLGGDGFTGGSAEIDAGVAALLPGRVDIGVTNARDINISRAAGNVGFHGATAVAQQTITGSIGDSPVVSGIMLALANLGLVIDSTT